jgi:hypothetical protein
MKQNFYIFLDIDGVLWDEHFISKIIKSGIRLKQDDSISNYFKPSSMRALNFLINTLKEHFEVILVISSNKRMDMQKTVLQLKNNGLTKVNKIDHTPVLLESFDMDRGLEIKNYLTGKPNNQNHCVIDDEINDITPYIKKENIIKTSDQKALSLTQVKEFLKREQVLTEELEP